LVQSQQKSVYDQHQYQLHQIKTIPFTDFKADFFQKINGIVI